MISIDPIPTFSDNYAYLIETQDGVVAVVDPGESEPVINILQKKGLHLDYILITHHHWDHVDGIPDLVQRYHAKVVAPKKEARRIGQVNISLKGGDIFKIGSQETLIIETPGHTLGGICFYFKDSNVLFTGDTLFSMGCGKIFEGTAMDMFTSFQKIMSLPDETMIYCGHEYTKGNAGFCLALDRDNLHLKKRIEEVKELRKNNLPTIPVTLGTEKKTNIFMKAKSAEEFAALRKKKDNF